MQQLLKVWRCSIFLMVWLLTARTAIAAPFDQQFIDSMIPHHQSALMMAEMAVKKAPHAPVKALARRILADQKREIAQMKAWRQAWYPNNKMPMNHMGHSAMNHSGMSHGKMEHSMMGGKMSMPGTMMGLPMKQEMDMGKLSKLAPVTFEREFLQMMIPHHAGAIIMAREALNVSGRPQIRQLAHQIIDSQSKEIGEMYTLHHRYHGKM